jgi:hypothetical protein
MRQILSLHQKTSLFWAIILLLGWLPNGGHTMLKLVAFGLTTLFLTASPQAYAQIAAAGAIDRLTAGDVSAITDARINLVKAALQLTPDQEKMWPAVEDAIRARAKDRATRLGNAETRLRELRDKSPIEALRDRNPVEFLHRRADVLAQRAADLKKLADAWQPLYQTLNPEQRRRMAGLAVLVFREMRDGLEQRRLRAEGDEG